MRTLVHERSETDPGGERVHPGDRVGVVERVHERVLAHREIRHEEGLLEEEADPPPTQRGGPLGADRERRAVEEDLSHRRQPEPREHEEQARLPRARGADQPDELAAGDVEVEPVDRAHAPRPLAVLEDEPSGPEQRRRGPGVDGAAHAFLRWMTATGSMRPSRRTRTTALTAAATNGSTLASASG